MSPSVSRSQQRFMGAELGRLRAGRKTKTGMSEKQLREFTEMKGKMPPKGMPPKGMGKEKMPMHKMPGGHMMKDSEMKRMMKKGKK